MQPLTHANTHQLSSHLPTRQVRGLRVALLERGPLKGRAQEWNISRKELAEVVATGVLTAAEVKECIAMEFNPVRVGFKARSCSLRSVAAITK